MGTGTRPMDIMGDWVDELDHLPCHSWLRFSKSIRRRSDRIVLVTYLAGHFYFCLRKVHGMPFFSERQANATWTAFEDGEAARQPMDSS